MAVNKVIFSTADGEQTLIDLTGDTAAAEAVFEGTVFHGADGEIKTGTFTIANELSQQDALIEQIKTNLRGKAAGGGEGAAPVIEPLEVTENGTYTAPEGIDGYSPVTVSVPMPDPAKPEQVKSIDITENGSYEILPDDGCVLSAVQVNVDVEASGGDELGDFISDKLTHVKCNATSIKAHAFRASLKVISVDFPEATSIGGYAFYGAKNLDEVNFPKLESVSSDGQIFYQCGMTSVVFPSLKSTGSTYFLRDCSVLEVADMPVLTSISSSAFNGCRSLKALILRSPTMVTLANTNAFTNCYCILGTKNSGYNPTGEKLGFIYVPKALLSDDDETKDYRRATNWSSANLVTQFRAIEDYPEITGGA